jgi:hypothetical protein
MAALVYKRRVPYAFEKEFRLLLRRPAGETAVLDSPDDFGRWVTVDLSQLLHDVRFHPAASAGFKTTVRQVIAAAGVKIPVRDSAFDKGNRV